MNKSNNTSTFDGRIKSFTFDSIETEVKTISNSKGEKEQKRTIKGFANTATIDRGRDLVLPEAFESSIEAFMGNPLMFYNHDWDEPVGLITGFDINEKGLFVEGEVAVGFAEADDVWKKIDQGLLRSFSIGFRTLDAEFDSKSDVYVIKDLELLEVSIVTIPMNADSTFEVDGKGCVKSIQFKTDEGSPVTYKELIKDSMDKDNKDAKASAAAHEERTTVMNCVSSTFAPEVQQTLEKHAISWGDSTDTFTLTFPKPETKESVNLPEIQTYSFQDGDCTVCDEEDIRGLSWAVTATGNEMLMCKDCFLKLDEEWSEQDSDTLGEFKEQVAESLSEANTIIKQLKDERDRLIKHIEDEVVELATKVTGIVK